MFLFLHICAIVCLSVKALLHNMGKFSAFDGLLSSKSNRSQSIGSNPRNGLVITFINGIYYTENDCKNISEYIGSIFNYEVRPFYNPSSGNWLSDASSAGHSIFWKPIDLDIAKNLALHLRKAIADVGTNGRVLHIAHSGGAIITYLAAKYHLNKFERSCIDVITFGGGYSITKKYFHGKVINYYASNDPLLLLDNRASTLSKRMNFNSSSSIEVRDFKHNTSFVFLEAIAKNPIIDHSILGPTYTKALIEESSFYKQRIKLFASFQYSQLFKLRLTRKYVARLTGFRHFWSDVSDSLQSAITYSTAITPMNFYGALCNMTTMMTRLLEDSSLLTNNSTLLFDIISPYLTMPNLSIPIAIDSTWNALLDKMNMFRIQQNSSEKSPQVQNSKSTVSIMDIANIIRKNENHAVKNINDTAETRSTRIIALRSTARLKSDIGVRTTSTPTAILSSIEGDVNTTTNRELRSDTIVSEARRTVSHGSLSIAGGGRCGGAGSVTSSSPLSLTHYSGDKVHQTNHTSFSSYYIRYWNWFSGFMS